MRHGEHVTPPTVAEVVQRAVDATYPAGSDAPLDDFLLHYEDRDEPVSALGDGRDREFFETAGRLEGQFPDADLRMAAAVATYLAFRRDEVAEASSSKADDVDLLRLAARAEYGEDPPEEIRAWLADAGIVT